MKSEVWGRVKNERVSAENRALWMLAVGALVVCTLISTAWAQRTREPSDPNATVSSPTRQPQEGSDTQSRTRKPQENPDARSRTQEPVEDPLMIEGQRIAVETILEAVRNLAATTEAALQAQGDARDEATQILSFELVEMQNHIRRLEGRLAKLGQPGATRQRDAETTTARKRTRDTDTTDKQTRTTRDRSSGNKVLSVATIRNQIARAEARLKQLEEQGQGDSEEAQRVRLRIRKLRQQLTERDDAEPDRQR
jgi:hypothetical protein